MNNNKVNFPCQCSHDILSHGYYAGLYLCFGCAKANEEMAYICKLDAVHPYKKISNLKYMEQQYEKTIGNTNE